MRKRVLFSLLIVLLAGCAEKRRRMVSVYPEQRKKPVESPAADGVEGFFASRDSALVYINGRVLTRGDFLEAVFRKFGEKTLLSEVIKEEIFLQEAERRKLTVAPKDVESGVEEALDSMSRDLGRGDEAAGRIKLADLYEKQGLTLNDVRGELRRKLVAQILIKRVTIAMRAPADVDLRELYEKSRRYHTRHIAYSFPSFQAQPDAEQKKKKEEARAKAESARAKISAGELDFVAVARAESDDQAARPLGGSLGPITAETPMAKSLKDAIFSLKPGEISEPVENPRGGYHLFQVTSIEPSRKYEEVAEEVRKNYLKREPEMDEIRKAYYRLRGKTEIDWPGR